MLRVKKVRRYRKARYPRGCYRPRIRNRPTPTATKSASALLLMALTEACEGGGTGVVGPPPVMPEMVTETEARQVVRQVFSSNGIDLQDDFPLVFRWASDSQASDSLAFEVDGFSESLQVGFEYIDEFENGIFTTSVKTALNEAVAGEGPYVKVLETAEKFTGYEAALEAQVQSFIDFLRAQGII